MQKKRFVFQMIFLYLLKKYGMMVDVLVEVLKAIDEYLKWMVDTLEILEW